MRAWPRARTGVFLIAVGLLCAADAAEVRVERIAPPEWGFFSKQVAYQGIPIKAHESVADAALIEAHRRVSRMLDKLPAAAENLADAGAEIHVIGKNQQTSDLPYLRHWKGKPYETHGKQVQTIDTRTRGIGGLQASCGEENLLKLPSDRYKDHRDICSHEFAHTLLRFGLSPDVQAMVRDQFKKSTAKGLWKTAYASTNHDEFFAELTMWYVGSRGDFGRIQPPPTEGQDWLRQYDPEAFDLLDRLYSGRVPLKRITFEPLLPRPAADEPKLRSLSSTDPTCLIFVNRTATDYALFWLDFEGKRKPYGILHAGEKQGQNTFATHPWVIVKPDGSVAWIYVPGSRNAKVTLQDTPR